MVTDLRVCVYMYAFMFISHTLQLLLQVDLSSPSVCHLTGGLYIKTMIKLEDNDTVTEVV